MKKANKVKKEQDNPELKKLIAESTMGIPEAESAIKGNIVSIAKGEIRVDINGIAVGVVRGREFMAVSRNIGALKPGDEVECVVIEKENENGEVELGLKGVGGSGAGSRSWVHLNELAKEGTILNVTITEANKGGLMATLEGVQGFLPVSQLSPEHYPRVAGGDKSKIFDRLKDYIGKEFKVKVLDAIENEGKLIFSEKAIWEAEQKHVLEKYKVGDSVQGTITALTSFGAFVSFGEGVEGLVHISEIAWQRIDHPKDIVAIGDTVTAQIIQIDGSKIFLSMKRLSEDPWRHVGDKYKAGQKVKGTVIKVNPFGLFVELDKDIHGLAHASELSNEPMDDISMFAKPGDVFDFEIINLEPAAHRLGMRIWGVTPKEVPVQVVKEEAKDGAPVAEAKVEEKKE